VIVGVQRGRHSPFGWSCFSTQGFPLQTLHSDEMHDTLCDERVIQGFACVRWGGGGCFFHCS